MSVAEAIQSSLPHVTELRHRLHRIPELMFEEYQTAALIRNELDRLGIAYTAGVAGAPTATIALIGDASKPCIALRADIDALPIVERTGKPYASTHDGRMHACGHDGHISMLLGAAAILKGIERELGVCVKLIWQPAEEGGGGADVLVKQGVLDGRLGPKVRAIFGIHGWPGLPVGYISTKPGPLLAATDYFEVTLHGQPGHAAFPQFARDPIVASAEAILNLQQIASREIDPTDSIVVSVTRIKAGSADNIIPAACSFSGTVRTLIPETRRWAQEVMRRRVEGIAAANACRAEFRWDDGYPPTINDPAMADFVAETAREIAGAERFIPAARAAMGGEDFAYYLEKVPGCFYMIGVCPPGVQCYPSLHNDCFDFTDAALATGIRMHIELARRFPA
jgi:amidohydrolase